MRAEVKQNQSCSAALTDDALNCEDEKVKLYTGLPCHATLKVVFEFFTGVIFQHLARRLAFLQFFMTLVNQTWISATLTSAAVLCCPDMLTCNS